MNRFAQFVRSLFPTDPTQLLLIAGLVCLTIVPRLNWLPSDISSFFSGLPYAGYSLTSEIRHNWFAFVGVASYAFMFAASAGFFACCWPGKRPAVRILSMVILPASVGLCAICAKYLNLLETPRSVLDRESASGHGLAWAISNLWKLGSAFHFCVAGLVLVGAFAVLLALRKASLPISIAHDDAAFAEETDAWKGCKKCIWIFQGAPPLTSVPMNAISLLLLLIPARTASTWRYQASRALWPVAEAVVFLPIAIWAMGKDNRKFIRQQIQIPKLSYAGLGLAIAALPVLLPSLLVYLYDRADWAAHSYGKFHPPLFGDYFGVPEAWMVTLFFAAFAEEVIFRGVLQRHFIERFGAWRGICFVGIVWGAFHFFGDVRYRLGDLGVAMGVSSRLILCVILGFGLSWLTLRSKSLLPATIAHGLYNAFADFKSGFSFRGQDWVHVGLWALFAYVLLRYWPVETTPSEFPLSSATVTEPAA
jgi:membrane protease YdiL (CAAX protease family)